MHSSRMRTGRSLTVCCSLLPGGGGFCSRGEGGVCSGGWSLLPGGCLLQMGLLWGVSAPRGCLLLGGVCSQGGVSVPGGVCSREVSAPGGVSAPGDVFQHALRQTPSPLWTEFLTHACENITLAQLRCSR